MTEAEWLTATDPYRMTEFLRTVNSPNGRKRSRKFRQFLVACSLLQSTLLQDSRSRTAIQVADAHAQGLTSRLRLIEACRQAEAVPRELRAQAEGRNYCTNGYFASIAAYLCAATSVGPERVVNEFLGFAYAAGEDRFSLSCALSGYLRDLFTPFSTLKLNPRWQTETVVALATAIYAERAFDRMPILADALEEAGCDHTDILSHCRGDGPHVRGCWVVDLLLGRS